MKRQLKIWITSIVILLMFATFAFSQGEGEKRQLGNPTESKATEGAINYFLPFAGMWMPGITPSLIGSANFKTLTNFRYRDGGLEGVNGYSLINSTKISTDYWKPRSGYYYHKDSPTESHIIIQAYDSRIRYSKIYENQTAIPELGEFDATALHTDLSYSETSGNYGQDTGFGNTHQTAFVDTHETVWASASQADTIIAVDTPRAFFSPAPQGQIVYSNGVESSIWAGNEHRIASFVVTLSDVTNYVIDALDYTDRINNEYDDSANVVSLSGSGGTVYWLVASTRPISGVSYWVKTANTTTGVSVEVALWNGTAWIDQDETDTTAGLTTDGAVTFTSSVGVSKEKYLLGQPYHYYLFQVVGDATLYHATLQIPWQALRDTWDRQYRIPISFNAYLDGDYKDWTLEVNYDSIEESPIGAEIGGMESDDGGGHFIIMFSDRQQAICFDILSGNTNILGPSGSTPYYWSGVTWVQPNAWHDGTADLTGVTPLGRTGVVSWSAPDDGEEFQQELFGVYGWAYKFEYSGVLGGTGADEEAVIIDRVYGITAPLTLRNFKFPAFYLDRVFLFSDLKGNEANKANFSAKYAPDVWNGQDTSDGYRNSIYFGTNQEITAATSLFNRYGNDVFSFLVVFKANELYIMKGKTPDTFVVEKISGHIGCPAPQTVTSVEVGYELVSDELLRNVVVWLSSSNPMTFDGTTPQPIRGIDRYFDVEDEWYLGANNIKNAFAWYDSNKMEWNLRVSDKWFAYDFYRRKWFLRDTGDAELPQMALRVEDVNGANYTYAGLDTGYLVRTDNSGSWNGVAIDQIVETGDFFLGGTGWNETLLRRFKLAYEGISESSTAYITHYAEGVGSGTSLMAISLGGSTDGQPLRATGGVNQEAWLHRFRLDVSTSDTPRGFRPLGFGYQEKYVREDE